MLSLLIKLFKIINELCEGKGILKKYDKYYNDNLIS